MLPCTPIPNLFHRHTRRTKELANCNFENVLHTHYRKVHQTLENKLSFYNKLNSNFVLKFYVTNEF